MFVIKLTDPKYSDYGYITKGGILVSDRKEFFLKEYVFESDIDARKHINVCLSSGWYRTDITEDNFELVEVKEYPELGPDFCYTEEGYKKYKDYI